MIYIKSIAGIDYDKLPTGSYLKKIPWIENFKKLDLKNQLLSCWSGCHHG